MDLKLEDLSVHNVDLHFHAGLERQRGRTLADYLNHALVTGRVVLGITDHLGRYLAPKKTVEDPNYEQTLAGLRDFRADVDRHRGLFPALRLFFGPEISPNTDLEALAENRAVLDVSDHVLCEFPGVDESADRNTERKIQRIQEAGAFATRTGKPVFIAHPFRAPVNYRLVKRDIEPWITALPAGPDAVFSEAELNRFFLFDIRAVARVARASGVPLEVNGGTHNRIRNVNLPAPLRMLRAAYRIIRDEGVELVPGSDQHGLMQGTSRGGYPVPYDTFEALDLCVADMTFVRRLLTPVSLGARSSRADSQWQLDS